MKISAKSAAQALFQSLSTSPADQQPSIVSKFWRFVISHRLKKAWPIIFDRLEEFDQEQRGIKVVTVETPYPIDEPARQAILAIAKKVFATANPQLKVVIKRQLLGGVRLLSYGQRLDLSINRALSQLERIE